MAGNARVRRSRLLCCARQDMVIIPHILLLSTPQQRSIHIFPNSPEILACPGVAISIGTGYNSARRNFITSEHEKEVQNKMSEEFGPTFVTVTDDDGREIELEHLDTMEFNGNTYMAFFPAEYADAEEEPVDDEEYGLIILKVIQENGEEILSTIDDEEELMAVYEQFMEYLFEDEEEE